MQAYLVVDRLHQQADEGEHAFARGRQGHDERLQAGRYHLAAVGAAHVAVHAGAQHGDGAQQHDVLLGAGGAVGGNFVQRCGPERPVVEAGQRGEGFAAPAGLLVGCFGVCCFGVGCPGVGCSGIGCFGRKTGCGRFRKFFRRYLRSIIITVRMRV